MINFNQTIDTEAKAERFIEDLANYTISPKLKSLLIDQDPEVCEYAGELAYGLCPQGQHEALINNLILSFELIYG